MPTYYFERALFIVGEQNSGKSTQLRSMFRDVRLGTGGKDSRRDENSGDVPTIERALSDIRLTSPHEAGEWIKRRPRDDDEAENFLEKTEDKLARNTPDMGRR